MVRSSGDTGVLSVNVGYLVFLVCLFVCLLSFFVSFFLFCYLVFRTWFQSLTSGGRSRGQLTPLITVITWVRISTTIFPLNTICLLGGTSFPMKNLRLMIQNNTRQASKEKRGNVWGRSNVRQSKQSETRKSKLSPTPWCRGAAITVVSTDCDEHQPRNREFGEQLHQDLAVRPSAMRLVSSSKVYTGNHGQRWRRLLFATRLWNLGHSRSPENFVIMEVLFQWLVSVLKCQSWPRF